MTRLAPLDTNALTGEQQRIASEIISGPRAGLRGPFEAWLRSPILAERAQLLGEYCRFHSVLPAPLRELAILLAGKHWLAQFEFWAHSRLGHDAGLDPAIIEAIRTDALPVFADDGQQLIYDFVTEYFATSRVSDSTYSRAVAILGEQGIVDLVGIVGYYGLVCMTLNVFDVPVPDGERKPFV